MLDSPLGQVGTPASSHIELGTPCGGSSLSTQTPAKCDAEEEAYLKARDYQGTRILSVAHLITAGSVLHP